MKRCQSWERKYFGGILPLIQDDGLFSFNFTLHTEAAWIFEIFSLWEFYFGQSTFQCLWLGKIVKIILLSDSNSQLFDKLALVSIFTSIERDFVFPLCWHSPRPTVNQYKCALCALCAFARLTFSNQSKQGFPSHALSASYDFTFIIIEFSFRWDIFPPGGHPPYRLLPQRDHGHRG